MKNTLALCPMAFDHAFFGRMKGIAIILMVMHHSFGFPEWYLPGVAYPSFVPYAHTFATATNICVGIYAIMTGYAYAFCKRPNLQYSLKKILDILCHFWMMWLLLAVLGGVFCGYRPAGGEIWTELTLVTLRMVAFGWYVVFYVVMMLLMPLVAKITERAGPVVTLFIAMSLWYNLRYVLPLYVPGHYQTGVTMYFPVVILGYWLARFGVMEWVLNKLSLLKWGRIPLALVMIPVSVAGFVVMYDRVQGVTRGAWILGAVLGFCLLPLDQIGWMNRLLQFLGKHSLNIWFFHGLFFSRVTNVVFQQFAYLPRNPVLVVAWILLVSTGVAVVMDWLYGTIHSLVTKHILRSRVAV